MAGDEMAVLIEMVVDLGGTELNFCSVFVLRNRCIARSRRRNGWCEFSARLFEAATDLVPVGVAQLFHRCGIGAKPVGDDLPRPAVPLHDPLEKRQRLSFVPLRPKVAL